MPMPTLNDPAHWRRRAAEARSIADQLDDLVAKKSMREIAEEYERIAAIAQQRRVADGSP